MQQQLEELNEKKAGPDGETSDDPQPVVPEGWSEDEWNDFKDDQPVTAELHEKQIRQVQEIKDNLNDYRTQTEAATFQEQFRSTVLAAHPDYDDLLKDERTHIEDFINQQANPIVKQAYQHVYDEGTAEEVVQLVSDYKAVRGNGQSVSSRKAKEAMAITGRAPSPNVGHRGRVDPDDFDQAWEDFPDDMDD